MGALRSQRVALRSLRPETLLIQVYCLMVALAFGLAAAIFAGGDERFSSETFKGPRDLVSWTTFEPTNLWSLLFVVLGMSLVWGIGKEMGVHILRFAMVVYLFLAITFTWSAIQSDVADLTSVMMVSVFAIAHALLSVHLKAYGWR